MVYKVSKQGMRKGYWKIVNSAGNTIKSGISSKSAVQAQVKRMNRK